MQLDRASLRLACENYKKSATASASPRRRKVKLRPGTSPTSAPQPPCQPTLAPSQVHHVTETLPLPTPASVVTNASPKPPAELREELILAIARYSQIKEAALACLSVPMIVAPPRWRTKEFSSQGKSMSPVLIDHEGYLLDGRHRVLAASALGVELEFEVTSRNGWAIAYEGLIARNATKSQVAGFAANLIDVARSRSRYRSCRKAFLHNLFCQVFGPNWTEKNTGTDGRPVWKKITVAAAKAFGVSETLIKQALRVPYLERFPIIDGRAIHMVLQDRKPAE